MSLKKKDRHRVRKQGISVREVSHVLIDEWRRWKSVAQIKDIIQVAVNEYRFDVNAVEDGVTTGYNDTSIPGRHDTSYSCVIGRSRCDSSVEIQKTHTGAVY